MLDCWPTVTAEEYNAMLVSLARYHRAHMWTDDGSNNVYGEAYEYVLKSLQRRVMYLKTTAQPTTNAFLQ